MSDVDEFLERAHAAMEVGDTLVARGYLRRAARSEPDRLDIWLDLCRVTERPQDHIECLQRVVDLDPANTEAQAELEQLRQEYTPDTGPDTGPDTRPDTGPEPEPVEEGQPEEEEEPAVTAPYSEPERSGMRLDVTDEMRRQWDEAIAAGQPLVCIDHPHRETTLRCNHCDAPICPECAVRTPVGFRCKECVKAQQAVFYNAEWYDYVVAALITLALSTPAAVIASWIGWFFALIVSTFIGGLIGGVVHRAIGRRRGKWIWLTVAVCIVLGAFFVWLARPGAILPIGIYAGMATVAAMGILRLGRSR
jgi:hypothetical protein